MRQIRDQLPKRFLPLRTSYMDHAFFGTNPAIYARTLYLNFQIPGIWHANVANQKKPTILTVHHHIRKQRLYIFVD